MDPAVVRKNDLFDRRAKLKRDRKVVAWITIGHALLLPIFLIWNGGLIGLGLVLLLALIVALWTWIDGVLSRRRMLDRLKSAVTQELSRNGSPKEPKIDAWLLVNSSLGIGIDAERQLLHLFNDKKPAERFDVSELRRISAERKCGLFGGRRDSLFISDALAGPGLELPVTEGDLHSFLQLVSRGSSRQDLDPPTLAASA
jgi:hypothetical protein